MGLGGVVAEPLDQDVLVRVLDVARPVEEQVPRLGRVASVKARVIAGQSSACSGFTGNLADEDHGCSSSSDRYITCSPT